MDIQNFAMQDMLAGVGTGIPGKGQKKGQADDGLFQSLLSGMGLLMAGQPVAQGIIEAVPDEGTGAQQGLPELFPTDMGKLIFLNQQDQQGQWGQAAETAPGFMPEDGLFALAGQQPADAITDAALRGSGQPAGDAKKALSDVRQFTLGPTEEEKSSLSGMEASVEARAAAMGPDGFSGSQADAVNVPVQNAETKGNAISSLRKEEEQARDKNAVPMQSGQEQPQRLENPFRTDKAASQVHRLPVKGEEMLPKEVSRMVTGQIRKGSHEFEIQLEPQNLGKIAIKVSTHENQTVISLSCSEEKTMQLMAQNAKELGAIMEHNLGVPAQILVEKQAPDYLNQEKQQEQGGRQRQQEEEKHGKRDSDDKDFLQKLRVGMMTVSEL